MADFIPSNSLDADHWCRAFAAVYSHRQACSLEDAIVVARLLFPSLGELPPSDAVTTVMVDPQLARALTRSFRPRRSQS